jgi:hypothetical protein
MPLNNRGEFRLRPSTRSSKISSGDTLIQRQRNGTEVPGTINFVFNTVPALTSWTDGADNSGTVSYPVSAGAPGTAGNAIPIARSPSGDYTLTLRFWRPQRRPVPGSGEGGDYIDIGGLAYEANIQDFPGTPPGGGEAPQCAASSLATSDPRLAVNAAPMGQVIDRTSDQPANPANTVTFTVNISKCAEARGKTVTPGAPITMDIAAVSRSASSSDHANQIIFVRPQ